MLGWKGLILGIPKIYDVDVDWFRKAMVFLNQKIATVQLRSTYGPLIFQLGGSGMPYGSDLRFAFEGFYQIVIYGSSTGWPQSPNGKIASL